MLSRFERHQAASYGAAAVPSKTMCRQTLTTPDGPERHRRFYLAVLISCGSCRVLSIADERADVAISTRMTPNGMPRQAGEAALGGRTDVRREPAHLRFDLGHRLSHRHFRSSRWQSWSEASVQKGIELSDFNPFEVTPPLGRRQSASGLGQSRVRQRSPCLRAAVVLAWHFRAQCG
jgi:hypothetical protein